MTTKVIFNIDSKLKAAAMKKARGEGITLSLLLNFATRSYVNDSLTIAAIHKELDEAQEEIRLGKGISQKEALRRLKIKLH